MCQDGLAKHLSNLSKIRPAICLRLDQVKFGPENPKSSRLEKSIHSLNSIALFRLIFLPPNLSSPIRISLKSSSSNQGRLCKFATLDRLDHNILLLAIQGLAYTDEINQVELDVHTFTVAWISCSLAARTKTSASSSSFQSSHNPPA